MKIHVENVNGVTTKLIEVTPDTAAAWLKQNVRNRRVNPKAVQDYARQMASGLWKLNGESIKIASDGTLLDGQHRLEAIVEAGVTLTLMVVEGLPPEYQDTMDLGRKRSAADAFAMDGVANATMVAAIGRRAWMWDQGNIRFVAATSPSPSEVKQTVEKYPHIHRSAEIAARTAMSYKPVRGAVAGTAHHLFTQLDQSLTAEFFAQLGSGADLEKGHPVLALRNRLMNDKMNNKRVPFHLGLALYIRAWNGRREARELDRLIHTAEEPMIRPV